MHAMIRSDRKHATQFEVSARSFSPTAQLTRSKY